MEDAGFDQLAWSTALSQEFHWQEFDHEYSLRHVRRLLKETGHTGQTPRPLPPTVDGDERAEFREDFQKLTSSLPEEYTTLAVKQTRKTVGLELYRAGFPEGKGVSLPIWKSCGGVILLGALTEDDEMFVTLIKDSFTSD